MTDDIITLLQNLNITQSCCESSTPIWVRWYMHILNQRQTEYRRGLNKSGPRFGEFCSCGCLLLLPHIAWRYSQPGVHFVAQPYGKVTHETRAHISSFRQQAPLQIPIWSVTLTFISLTWFRSAKLNPQNPWFADLEPLLPPPPPSPRSERSKLEMALFSRMPSLVITWKRSI